MSLGPTDDLGMGKNHIFRRIAGLVITLNATLLCLGCSNGLQSDSTSSAPPLEQKTEPAYCGSSINTSITNPYALSGTAVFKYRTTVINSPSGVIGLYGVSQKNIPYAEIHVLNSSGTMVQCGETGPSGEINLSVPKDPGNYTLKILARSNNSKLKAHVLQDINSNEPHSVSKSFSISNSESSQNLGTIAAEADESTDSNIPGGAFNILFQLFKANESIRSKTSNSSFVAEKVTVFWKAGFNPYSYFYSSDSDPLSFYLPGDRELYISGGKGGNVKTQDTDHFDNSVILHEYGHFLEDIYGKSESPGGSHNGDFIIDPRLAWSEGWANYIQASVIKVDYPTWVYYLDSVGYYSSPSDTTAGYLVGVNLSSVPGTGVPDTPISSGEGVFRELSISRTLYKSEYKSGVNVTFADIWSTFNNTRTDTNFPFKNSGRFLELLSLTSSANANSNFSAVLTEEKQNANTQNYATGVSASGSACAQSLIPVADTYDSQGTPKSNLLKSNDFYRYYYSGNNDILFFQYSTSSGNTQDLDLYIYSYTHELSEEADILSGKSNNTLVKYLRRTNSLDSGAESLSLSGLNAGWYLINVKANTYGKTSAQLNGTAEYQLKRTISSTTENLCPSY